MLLGDVVGVCGKRSIAADLRQTLLGLHGLLNPLGHLSAASQLRTKAVCAFPEVSGIAEDRAAAATLVRRRPRRQAWRESISRGSMTRQQVQGEGLKGGGLKGREESD